MYRNNILVYNSN